MIFALLLCFANVAFAQTEREKGIELYEKGDYKAAAESLQKATQTDSKDGEAWRFLGMAYARTNELKKSAKAFGEADNFADKDLNAGYDAPVEITSRGYPRFTEKSRLNQTMGIIKLAVEFGSDGKIKYVVTIRGLPDGLTENAIKAASKIRFKPAVRNGKTVTVIAFLEYSFAIH